MSRLPARRGFGLTVILLAVVLVGWLALPRAVEPQYECGHVSNVLTQLATIRGQIELYRVRHGGTFPDLTTTPMHDLVNCAGTNQAPDGNNYLRTAVTNLHTETCRVETGTVAPTRRVHRGEAAWIYNPMTGEIWVNGYDAINYRWY